MSTRISLGELDVENCVRLMAEGIVQVGGDTKEIKLERFLELYFPSALNDKTERAKIQHVIYRARGAPYKGDRSRLPKYLRSEKRGRNHWEYEWIAITEIGLILLSKRYPELHAALRGEDLGAGQAPG